MGDDVIENDKELIVQLVGDVDLEHCSAVRGLLLDGVSHGKDLLVDLSQVTYLDSSGIASLLEALQIANKAGTALKLFAANGQIMRVFELARLDKIFSIHPDLSTALATDA
jgi:anti-sigma B factor antagonist